MPKLTKCDTYIQTILAPQKSCDDNTTGSTSVRWQSRTAAYSSACYCYTGFILRPPQFFLQCSAAASILIYSLRGLQASRDSWDAWRLHGYKYSIAKICASRENTICMGKLYKVYNSIGPRILN